MRSARAITTVVFAIICLLAVNAFIRTPHATVSADDIAARAHKLHFSTYVIDTHDDTTQRFLSKSGFDLSKRYTDGSIDIPRMREGGMNGIFFSIWIDGKTMGPEAIRQALDQIDLVRTNVAKYPKDIVLCRTAEEVRRAHAQNKIAALMGVEGGHMIGNDIHIVNVFADLGVRYMTLSHFYNTEWSDSSTDKAAHNGLTDFGKEVVREMNRQGMMVDISHVADKTFWDALEVSSAPPFASHSSCRALSNMPRNMTDEMIVALAKKGGVVQVNFSCDFLSQKTADADKEVTAKIAAAHAENNRALIEEYRKSIPPATLADVVAHIDHIVKIAGINAAGIGSDFDGVSCTPVGLEDVSKFPNLTRALLEKGYSAEDIRKIYGGNTLRVMRAVEAEAKREQAN